MYIFKEKSDIDEERLSLLKARENIGKKLDYLKEVIKNPKAQEILSEIFVTRQEFIKAQEKFIAAIEKEDKEEAYKILTKDFRPIQLKYMSSIATMMEYQSTFAQKEANDAVTNIHEVSS